jgi:hypothetical protein
MYTAYIKLMVGQEFFALGEKLRNKATQCVILFYPILCLDQFTNNDTILSSNAHGPIAAL